MFRKMVISALSFIVCLLLTGGRPAEAVTEDQVRTLCAEQLREHEENYSNVDRTLSNWLPFVNELDDEASVQASIREWELGWLSMLVCMGELRLQEIAAAPPNAGKPEIRTSNEDPAPANGALVLATDTTDAVGGNAFGGAPDPSKVKKVHNPAMDRSKCVKIEQRANPNAQFGVVGSQRLVNECGETVEVFWCNVASDCLQDSASTLTLSGKVPDNSWPIDEGYFRFGACKGPNSGGFDKGSQGQTFTCPEWPEDP